ncbi:ArgE/DapE family deacylase [Streptomyces sp. NPDC087512]|uniref:M20 family metallopeptidase n=1 Tax=Streptomyces sp. NPDC087512 TaxID=3155059 RepID=UPI00342AB55C
MASHPADEHVIDRVETLSEELLEFLAASVRVPSESGWEDRVTDLYVQWFEKRGWSMVRQSLATAGAASEARAEERENVIAWYPRPSDRPTLILNGHIDVVPTGPEHHWTHAPYSGKRTDGRVHGRGSVDMKGGIAAGLYALAALEDLGFDPKFDIAVQLVVAEETTGAGTRAASLKVPHPAAAIFLEPTAGAVVPINSGLLFFTVEVTGQAAHTSAPWRGIDAADRLIRIRQALTELATRRSAAYRHPLFADVPTAIPFAIGTMTAGSWRAAVPDHATMSGRIGVAPGEPLEDVKAAFQRAVNEVTERDPWLRNNPPVVRWDHEGAAGWETPVNHPLIAALRSAQHRSQGQNHITGFTAGSDAAFYGARGIPTAVFGPGDVTKAHGPDEFVDERDVIEATATLALTLTRLDAQTRNAADLWPGTTPS